MELKVIKADYHGTHPPKVLAAKYGIERKSEVKRIEEGKVF